MEFVSRALFKIEELKARLAAVEAERDAAQAGEARAVEALRRCHEGAARQLAEPRDRDDDQYALTAIATDCEAVLADSAIALDWLAQLEREAAAKELEKILIGGNHLASALIHLLGDDFPEYETDFNEALEMLNDPIKYDLWVCWAIMMRERDAMNDPKLAAAIRAGKGVGE